MQPLVIEYVLDSHRPGYAFTAGTAGYDEATLKAIWRSAMPRGQGWRHYLGAESLKCFPLDAGRRVGIAQVTVTDQADEAGRQGIRRAEVSVIEAAGYLPLLKTRLAALPESVHEATTRLLTCWKWKRIIDRAAPKMRKKHGQIVLAAPYTSAPDWRVMEALVLRVATSRRLRAVKGCPRVVPLTTLALDPREESMVVALPLAEAHRLNGIRAITFDHSTR